jgi:hypothetical protein
MTLQEFINHKFIGFFVLNQREGSFSVTIGATYPDGSSKVTTSFGDSYDSAMDKAIQEQLK